LLYPACWGLALLTKVYRRGPGVAQLGPLGRLTSGSARALLDAAPDAGLEQLAALRAVMNSALLPAIAFRQGLWALGPVFAGSKIMPGNADLVAAGLLTELKTTSKKPSLGATDLWQILGYVFMDYDDSFGVTERNCQDLWMEGAAPADYLAVFPSCASARSRLISATRRGMS
jgi:hypothetical protein